MIIVTYKYFGRMLKIVLPGIAMLGCLIAFSVAYESSMGIGSLEDTAAFEPGPVVLELFTSQGCSSCPPADDFLREMAREPEWMDRVIPLAYHVDYWNYLGWKDPFSKKEWTDRQGDYVRAMGRATLYTPQVVIHGRAEVVGSQREMVKRAITTQIQRSEAHQFNINIDRLDKAVGVLRGEVSVQGKPHASDGSLLLIAVAFETGLSTDVPEGENAGKTLKNDFVVRNLAVLSRLQASSHVDVKQPFEISIDGDLDTNHLGLAVFVQDSSSMHIMGAAVQD